MKKGIKEGAVNTTKKVLSDRKTALEKIAGFIGLSTDEVKKIKAGQNI